MLAHLVPLGLSDVPLTAEIHPKIVLEYNFICSTLMIFGK